MGMDYLELLKTELRPALGCTEPAAVALAVARARELLGEAVDTLHVSVSGNVLKNAMGVGIPGTDMHGIKIAAALAAIAGESIYGLEVLGDNCNCHSQKAAEMVEQGHITVSIAETAERLYIEAVVMGGGNTASVTIAGGHTSFMHASRNGVSVPIGEEGCATKEGDRAKTSLADIWTFVSSVPLEELGFLQQTIDMNGRIAREGLSKDYGMALGRALYQESGYRMEGTDLATYMSLMAAAASDARMSGSCLPVMSTAGSGNQGLTASLPVMAAAEKLGASREQLLRALTLSQLVTIHIKGFIGKLSALCGCAIAASAGVCCALTYLKGGTLSHIYCAVQNMIADIAGLICDGAKITCSLKIATAVSGAVQCAALAVRGVAATENDGIIACQAENSIRNLGRLGNQGMVETDRVILDMMVCK